jgi:hypothetical protein
MAVLMTPPYLQFFDANGDPLAGGKVYTYTATGTFSTQKATFTTEAGDVEHPNPVILDPAGRPNTGNGSIWLSGTYDFVVKDSNDVTIETTLNVTAFTALPSASSAYFESFSGTGAQTAFTTSEDLGTDEKAIFVWVDAGGGAGLDIQNPSAYTINGTALTFSVAPASGTNNIFVSAPSTLVGAASSSAAAAAASAAAAAADAASTAADVVTTNADVVLTNADVVTTNADVVLTNADVVLTNADVVSTNADVVTASEWASKTTGLVAATDYSSKAWAIGGTGTTTNNAKYWSEQAAGAVTGDILPLTEQGSTPSTPASGVSKLYAKTDSNPYILDDTGAERVLLKSPAYTASKQGALAMQNSADNGISFLTSQGTSGQFLVSNGADADPSWQTGVGTWVLLSTQTASASATIDFTSNIDSTYRTYAFVLTEITPATDAVELFIRVSIDSGSSYISTGTYDQSSVQVDATSVTGIGGTTETSFQIHKNLGNASDESYSGIIYLTNPSSASKRKILNWQGGGLQDDGSTEYFSGTGSNTTTSAIDAIRFLMNTGNIASGTFKLYGVN